MQGSEVAGPHDEEAVEQVTSDAKRRTWERPTLTFEGNVEDLVLALGGKLSVTPGDAQENRKVIGL